MTLEFLKSEPTFFESVEMFFDKAAVHLKHISPITLDHIKAVDSSLRFSFPIQVGHL